MNEKDKNIEIELTEQQKKFCCEYVVDWNGARAAREAGYAENSAKEQASRLLTKDNIKAYIDKVKNNYEELAGISKLKIIKEHFKLAFNSMSDFHDSWMTRKEFDKLTEDQKACISEIKTRVTDNVEEVYIKLFDRQKSLDALCKLMGYNDPDKIDLSNKGDKFEPVMTTELMQQLIDKL